MLKSFRKHVSIEPNHSQTGDPSTHAYDPLAHARKKLWISTTNVWWIVLRTCFLLTFWSFKIIFEWYKLTRAVVLFFLLKRSTIFFSLFLPMIIKQRNMLVVILWALIRFLLFCCVFSRILIISLRNKKIWTDLNYLLNIVCNLINY